MIRGVSSGKTVSKCAMKSAFPPSGAAKAVQTWSSVRGQVQLEGLQDLRALQELEKKAGRRRVLELIYEEGGDPDRAPFTFREYPRDAEWICRLRMRVAEELKRAGKA